MIVNSIIHKIYLNIVSAIYKYWYKYICIHIYKYIYIYVYAVYDFCYHTIQISTLWSAYIYIYIDINSYIMILYTCCDIKHACIHWTFGESNMPWARGLANCDEAQLAAQRRISFCMQLAQYLYCQYPGVGTTCASKQILTFDLLFLWKAASALDVILWDHVHCQS